MLDSETLLSAAMVSKKWLNLCRADSHLRKRILQQIIFERVEQYLIPLRISIQRRDPNNYCPLSTVNGHHRMTVAPVSSKFSMSSSFVKINAMFRTALHNYERIMFTKYICDILTIVLLSLFKSLYSFVEWSHQVGSEMVNICHQLCCFQCKDHCP